MTSGRKCTSRGHTTLRRVLSAPSLPFEAGKPKVRDSRLTAAADKLSREEMELLELDILRPLDVYAIIRQIREQTVNGEELFQCDFRRTRPSHVADKTVNMP